MTTNQAIQYKDSMKDTADRLYESAGAYFAQVAVVLVEC